jgi:hypothetical protein
MDSLAGRGSLLIVMQPSSPPPPHLALTGLQARFTDLDLSADELAGTDLVLFCADQNWEAQIRPLLDAAKSLALPVLVWGELSPLDRVLALELGVDDVFGSECNPLEVRARVHRALRRSLKSAAGASAAARTH